MIKLIISSYVYCVPKFLGSVIGAVGGIIGSSLTGDAAEESADTANEFNLLQAQNKHQWEVEDLRKAGLNPILSANSNPSVAQAAQAQVPDYASAIINGANTGLAADRNPSIIAQTKAQTELTKTQNILQSNLIPGSAAIAKITTQLGNLIDVITERVGGAVGGYDKLFDDASELVTQGIEKITEMGGDVESFWNDLRQKFGAKMDHFRNIYEKYSNEKGVPTQNKPINIQIPYNDNGAR